MAAMGFLDGLCDLPDDADMSWRSFLLLKDVCSLTSLGAVASGLVALLSFFVMLVQYRLYRRRVGRRPGGRGGAKSDVDNGPKRLPPRSSVNNSNGRGDGGREESKGRHADYDDDDDDDYEFMSRATEPLLSSSADDRDDTEEEEEEEEWERSRGGGSKTAKKGTGVHWAKLPLYWTQAAYHLGMGAFYLVDGRTNEPYQCELVLSRGSKTAVLLLLLAHACMTKNDGNCVNTRMMTQGG